MRRICLLAIVLITILSACVSTPDDIELLPSGETPFAFPPPSTTTTTSKPKATVELPTATGSIGDIKRGKLFHEAVRLSSVIVSPTLIDSRFNSGAWGAVLMYRPDTIGDSISPTDGMLDAVLRDYGYVTGARIEREPSGDSTISVLLQDMVLIFKDDASAAAATEVGFRLRDEQSSGTNKRVRPIEIPDFPQAKAYAERTNGTDAGATIAYVQRGPVVVRIATHSIPDDEAAKTISRYLASQLSTLERFAPTPVDKLSSLTPPFDPDGSLLKLASDSTTVNPLGIGGVFDTNGALLRQDDFQGWSEVYEASGVDRLMVSDTGEVIRAADESGATRVLAKARPEFVARKGYKPTGPPPTLPSADCIQYVSSAPDDDPLRRCLFTRGRYVTWVEGKQSVLGQRVQDQWNRLG
ncbi:hypothetical protein [Mycobacteroides salmoniphilum]|uniref:DUF7373 family lipoprotein n=1 Tax=Mycobacteroides salmoniphilum TaxID=404941 RepID=UPI000992C80B|nr:hypothetical protein [Mycobacteroides salmoniphilum]QCH25791.1 hypothetical protein DSM43276_04077 [Mycobacteroides salmoniphilum]